MSIIMLSKGLHHLREGIILMQILTAQNRKYWDLFCRVYRVGGRGMVSCPLGSAAETLLKKHNLSRYEPVFCLVFPWIPSGTQH